MMEDLGSVYTRGSSFRARAEARQRHYRAHELKVGWRKYGHWLDEESAGAGRNFLDPEIHEAAVLRQAAGKGIASRTFENMLSSQAMCFNLFAPLQNDLYLAGRVLRKFFPSLEAVTEMSIEYTPDKDLFWDQTGRGGVDCDLLIQGMDRRGDPLVIVLETKFVEPEFSTCGFRKPGRAAKGYSVCPSEVGLAGNMGECLYVSRKGYRYWERSHEQATLAFDRLPRSGCPFGGGLWQLWVNHTLAHEEAARRNAAEAVFAVCAPGGNNRLLRGGTVLEEFRGYLQNPGSLAFVDLDDLIRVIEKEALGKEAWISGLTARYAGI